ncbi:pyridoxamine 5'-phosphate oxidase family protein [Agromyces lapidis]|uniref:Pyridoxamine 5'-phosphate oxidase family protein n=1 Tax=Agromyces lapidis TaxID=279574 RepID=A0ABV5SKR4_9MICO|nr:pyridoxamine 5'-phosphate oxidase family protein [Agromyces lapidis]
MDETEEDRTPTRSLTEADCWERLARAPYGRIAMAAGGEVDIFAVNHVVDTSGPGGPVIVFRTAAGTKLLELTIRHGVAFQIDGFSDTEAFSVVVKGTAEEFDHEREIEAAEALGITPWAPESKDRWVRITPTEVHGREFDRATT